MDSHLHNPRQRSRLRVSRAFTPPPQRQYVQQMPPAPSSHFLPQQHPLQHRLSLVEDHFPHAMASGAGVPLEHCDIASLLAYRQRINGLYSSHPADMVPHLPRNQNIVWPQRPQAFHGNDGRLPLSDDYGRQGAFDREYRDGRDDLRSLSELDSSRRSAALSAKIFLDDVRAGFQRGAPFEPGPAVEFNRHRIDREEALPHESLLSKSSERLMERGARKRNREDATTVEAREGPSRLRRFQDPGLAAIPRTPESSRDLRLLQRKLPSGCSVDVQDRQDRVTSPKKRQESFHVSPAKRVKKKLLSQQRKAASDVGYISATKLKRLDDPKDKLASLNNRIRKFDGQQGGKNCKGHSSSPQTPSFIKNGSRVGVDVTTPKNKPDDSEVFGGRENSSVMRISGKRTATSTSVQGPKEHSPNQELTARPSSSARKTLRAVESIPRSKNVKTRVIRLLGSDAKICVASPQKREGKREGNARELQMTNGQEVVHQVSRDFQHDKANESEIKVKQEQLVLTEKCTSLSTPTTIELPISLHMPIQNFIDSRCESTKDREIYHGHEREQSMMCSEGRISEQENRPPCWLSNLQNSGDLFSGKAVNASQPSTIPMQEQIQRERNSNRPLLTLSMDIDVESMETRGAQSQQSSMIGDSSLLSLPISRKEMLVPVKPCNIQGMTLDLKEPAGECEVRLFGKSLKAPVAKVSLRSPEQLGMLDSSVSAVPNSALSLSQLSSDNHLASVSLRKDKKEADADTSSSLMVQAVVKDKELVNVGVNEAEDTVLLSYNQTNPNFTIQTAEALCKMQDPLSISFKKAPEMVPIVENVLPPEILADNVVEIQSDSPLCSVPQLERLAKASAADHEESLTRLQATMNVVETSMSSGTAAGQAVPKESVAVKELATQENRSQALLEHEDRREAPSTEKPSSFTLPKTMSLLHQQVRAHKLPGRAGANTWHRSAGNNPITSSQVLSKPVFDKHTGSQKGSEVAAYVRKGNSLVRAPISSITGVSPPSNPTDVAVRKDLAGKGLANLSRGMGGYPGGRNVVHNTTRYTFKQAFPSLRVEAQETAAKVVNGDKLSVAREESGSLQAGLKSTLAVTSEKQYSEALPGRAKGPEESTPLLALPEAGSNDLGASIQPRPQVPTGQSLSASLKLPDSSSSSYVMNKANQSITGLPMKVSQAASCPTNASNHELYYKPNTNQLVRNGTDTKKRPVEIQALATKTHPARQSSLKKVFRKRSCLSSSRVWTLKDGSRSLHVQSVLPFLFPWKRPGFGLTARAGKLKALPKARKGSLLFLISKRLQRLRKLQPVYRRSAGGFAIRRSGILSLTGANLKWTKSIERRSKLASEEATKAVAAVEKQRRNEAKAVAEAVNGVTQNRVQRKLAREVSHGRKLCLSSAQWRLDAEVKENTKSALLSMPKRLSYDGTEVRYVRVGNGHKLVRDPKAATRALANEKVRWSLHTARSRWAKSQQYCLFFTRFGKCNKSQGGCPYIHDPEKIAVCTKFLKGTCSGTNCSFSHKVIPERMPDCSFFLEGLCTNEECPYRHVNVNPKASICEGFLKGFCADGDACNKKHTTVCPTYLATGECLDKLTCKLHHPKKKCKRAPSNNLWKSKSKRRRRYFGSESMKCGQRLHEAGMNSVSSVDDFGDEFIAVPDVIINVEENEEFKRKLAFIKEHMSIPQGIFEGESDMLVKPVLLLQKRVSA